MTPTLPLRLLLSASAVALSALAATAGVASPVLPTGGSVRAGNATIGAPIGTSLTVNQTSSKAVIDWSTFSIGAGGKVSFDNGHGVTLNRVIGAGQSDIFGTLTSTGSVFLLNQNGVFIGKGGAINVGGSFVASSLDMTDNAFMNGGVLTLSGPGRGAVTNQGDIVATAGDVELIGQQVANGGTIRAPGGEVGFAAGPQVTLSQGAPTGEKLTVTIGDPATSITNTGLVTAASAELRANGGNIYALAINAGSRIEATGIASKGGDVYLTAGSGALTAQGEIDATHADGSGGFVETSGHTVDFTGLRVRAGQWLIDPVNLTIDQAAASTIDANLATTSVTLKTTAGAASVPGVQSAGAGDIVVDAPIAWASANTLTLDAFHSINIDAAVTASGAGKVVLITNDGGSGGDYSFGFSPAGFAGSLSFSGAPNTGQALNINGQPYTLIYSEADLVNVNNNLGGFYALAAPLELNTFLFTDSPVASTVATPFTGVFTGLGNSISGLSITDTSPEPQTDPLGYARNGLVGLFGEVGPAGRVRDLDLANVRVEGASGMVVGGLAGEMFGTATDVSSSGIVLVANSGAQAQLASAGGLFGALPGTASDVSSSAEVAGGGAAFVGGVAGAMGPGASLTNSSASGEVLVLSPGADQAALAGGLVGVVYGFQIGGVNPKPATLAGDYATGDVLGGGGSFVGGLAGEIIEANVTTSYATGAVTQIAGGVAGVQEDIAGGFVGYVGPGVSITRSYASGAVATVAGPASDTARTTLAGGFSGDIDQGSTISDAYALGSVTSTGAGTSAIGGFSGLVINSASIADSYATGQVSAAAGIAKGFVGLLASSAPGAAAATIADDYWDEGTTGQTSGYLLAGGTATNVIGIGGSTGLSPYAASSYANFNLASTWYLINGETRPILRSEYSTDITNAHQLELMGLNLAANYTLGADFSAAETTDAAGVWNPANGFVPVGPNIPNGFTGSLDGAGHTISGLTIVDNTPVNQLDAAGVPTNGWAGLFGFVSQGGVVENLTIANASVTAGDGIYAGVLAGGMLGTVINTSTSGRVTVGSATNTALGVADSLGGGLVGGFDGIIDNSSSSAIVSGGDALVGGLVGATGGVAGVPAAAILFSHATGAVSVGGVPAPGSDRPIAGGLVGYLSSQSGAGPVTPTVVANSYATGAVTGGAGSIVGGFVGAVIDSSITTSYATGSVSQTAGGANGEDNVAGGFVGAFQGGTIINESWASGAVNTVGDTGSNFTFAGGFAGDVEQGAVVETDYSLGPVSATGSTSSLLGGFAGIIQTGSSADQVYATGAVTGPGGLGGLVGFMDNTGSLTNGYWDEGTTGVTVAVGSNAGGTVSNVTGIGGSTGLSPYAASTYANFDLANEWYIINGETRPILRAEYSTDITDTHQLELMGLNLGASYTLAGDVNAGDTQSAAGIWNPANGFVPVGSLASPFTGTLNGQGHAVANLTIIDTTAARAASDQYSDVNGTVGLFGTVRGPNAVVENLALTNVAVTGGDGMDVGAVAGALIEGALIDVSSSGVVTAGSGVHPTGGQVGYASAGGLVGEAGPNGTSSPGVRIDSSSSAAKVVGSDAWSGGLVGHTTPGTSIAGSFASGAVVTGATVGVQTAEAGGLVGSDFGATIAGSYATGDASGASGASIGGFAGLVVAAKITTSWASGAASLNGSGGNVGGFAAFVQSGTITQSFSSGAVSATNQAAGSSTNAGGFAGYVDGTISQAYSTGSVTTGGAADQVGGFAGEIDAAGSVDQVYATGRVGTPGTAGGLAGILGGALANSYWDEGTTSRVNGFNLSGAGAATAVTGMGGTTNVNPFDAATYAGWDFNNTWSTPSAGFYPELFGVSHVIRVTVANSTAVYGGFPVFSYTAFGFQDGDPASIAREVDGLQGGPVGATLSTAGFYNVGVHPVQAFNGSASDPSGTYRIIYVDGQLNVTPRPISASLGGTVEKTYDGTTAADATTSNLTLNGALPADQVSLASGFTSAYASKNAGTGVVVTASGLTLTGADASDYSVSGSTSGAVGIIDPKALVASLTGQVVKAADGTTIATLGANNYAPLNGVVSGDSVNLNDPTTGVYDSAAVGQGRTVTVTGLALVGPDAGDYTVNNSAQAPIGVIQPTANVVQVNIVTTPTGDITQPLGLTGDQSGGAGDQSASTGGHPRVTPETVFPYATSATQQTQSGDSSPVTGEGNGDLWWGSDEDDDKKDKR
jgi:filamentous hemagglutinin family protein